MISTLVTIIITSNNTMLTVDNDENAKKTLLGWGLSPGGSPALAKAL